MIPLACWNPNRTVLQSTAEEGTRLKLMDLNSLFGEDSSLEDILKLMKSQQILCYPISETQVSRNWENIPLSTSLALIVEKAALNE